MEQPSNLFELHLDQQSLNYLNEAARWARFLSIVGFITSGLMIIFGVFFASALSTIMSGMSSESGFAMMGGGFLSFMYIFLALIIFFPSLYLFNFSSKMRRAFQNNDQQVLSDSLKSLKSFFKFYGIFTVIILSFYVLAIIAGVIGALVGHRA
jgi:uncharacterized membrane protein